MLNSGQEVMMLELFSTCESFGALRDMGKMKRTSRHLFF